MNEKHSKLSRIAGKNLVIIRKQLHLTQEQCAELIGITASHLSNFENGKCNVSLKVIEQILDALPISPNELLTERSKQKKETGLQEIILKHMESFGFSLYLDLLENYKKGISENTADYKIPPKKREPMTKVAGRKKK